MANVNDISNFFIDLALKSENDLMTNLRLNKLLYFAQAMSLVKTNTPIYNDEIEAWAYGPVVPQIYNKYKKYGRKDIDEIDEKYTSDVFSPNELDILFDTVNAYDKYSTGELVRLTHIKGSPWDIAFNVKNDKIISKDDIKNYYEKNIVIDDFKVDKLYASVPCFERDENGVLIIPKGSEYAD